MLMSGELLTLSGACHCGAVRFEIDVPADITVHDCNCSICRRGGYLHVIVPASRFRLQAGAHMLTEYRFNTGVARHRFCSVCGIKGFYVPRSNPDSYSVNLNCLDRSAFTSIRIQAFDGDDWESAMKHNGPISSESPHG